jgi:hypothetical protein
MRYSELTKVIIKEDGEACAAPAGDTTSASVATVVSALGASTQKGKKKNKPIVLKRM